MRYCMFSFRKPHRIQEAVDSTIQLLFIDFLTNNDLKKSKYLKVFMICSPVSARLLYVFSSVRALSFVNILGLSFNWHIWALSGFLQGISYGSWSDSHLEIIYRYTEKQFPKLFFVGEYGLIYILLILRYLKYNKLDVEQ